MRRLTDYKIMNANVLTFYYDLIVIRMRVILIFSMPVEFSVEKKSKQITTIWNTYTLH